MAKKIFFIILVPTGTFLQLCISYLETELNLDPDSNPDPNPDLELITDTDPDPNLQIISDPSGSECTTLS
jgi:hypothetical protein